jgi:hypothetical protein
MKEVSKEDQGKQPHLPPTDYTEVPHCCSRRNRRKEQQKEAK